MDNYNNYNNPNNPNYNPNYNPNQNSYQNTDGRLNYPQPSVNGVPVNGTPISTKPQPKTGWSWGASMLGCIWGFGNHTYMPFLSFIPILNMFWWIICGIKGYEWALNSGHFKTVEEFNAVQDSWDRAGKFYLIFMLIILAVYFLFFFVVFGATLTAALAELSTYSY